MFGLFKKSTDINTAQIVDEIEAAVYAHLKHYGFRKHGRTLHRFVSGDLSQVIHDQLQNGHKLYLKKGERVVFMGQDITAEKDGFVTLYGANRGYIDHLDELEITLGLR